MCEVENHDTQCFAQDSGLFRYLGPNSPVGPAHHRVGGRHCSRSGWRGRTKCQGSRCQYINQSRSSEPRLPADGRYSFPSLPPGGPYTIRVEAAGFSTEERTGITLEVNQAARLDFKLKVGAITETVEVTGASAANRSHHRRHGPGHFYAGHRQPSAQPKKRLFAGLSRLRASRETSASLTTATTSRSTAAGREAPISWWTAFPRRPALPIPSKALPCSLPWMRCRSSRSRRICYSAEFGRSGSGIINLIYKSGTNQFHGSVYEFLRNSDLDANNFFSNRSGVPLPNFKRNQFGASLGGPVEIPKIYRARTRPFSSSTMKGCGRAARPRCKPLFPPPRSAAEISPRRLNATGQLVIIYDPTTTVAQGSGYVRPPFPGNIIPANRIDPVAKNIVNYYPLPNQPGVPYSGVNNYYVATTSVVNTNSIDAKVDENLNDRNRFFVRYSRLGLSQPAPMELPVRDPCGPECPGQSGANQQQRGHRLHTYAQSNGSAGVPLRLRAHQARLHFDQPRLQSHASWASPVTSPPMRTTWCSPVSRRRTITVSATLSRGTRAIPGLKAISWRLENTRILGAHTLRFGWEGRLLRSNDTESGSSTGNFSFAAGLTQGPNPEYCQHHGRKQPLPRCCSAVAAAPC